MGLWGWWIDTGWHKVQINPNLRPGGLGEAEGLEEAIPCQVVMRRLKLGEGGGASGGWGWDSVAREDRERDLRGMKYFDILASGVLCSDRNKTWKWLTKSRNIEDVRGSGWGGYTASRTAGMVTVAAGWLGGWCMVTVAHALVHGIRGTVSNLLFRLYVGQEWLSPSTLSTGGVPARARGRGSELAVYSCTQLA